MKNLFLILFFIALFIAVPVLTYALPKSFICTVISVSANDSETIERLQNKYLKERFTVDVITGRIVGDSFYSGFEPFDLRLPLDVISWGSDSEPWKGELDEYYLQIEVYSKKNFIPFTFVISDDQALSGGCLRSFI